MVQQLSSEHNKLLEKWNCHKDIGVSILGNVYLFKRIGSEKNSGDRKAFYIAPLTQYCKFKIQIKEIDTLDRKLMLGISSKKSYIEIEKTLGSFKGSSHYHFYWGYSMINLQGKLETSKKDDPKGHAPEKIIFLEYIPQKEVKIYNQIKSVDLHSPIQTNEEPYYFFVNLPRFGSSCTVEKVFYIKQMYHRLT